MLYSFQLLALEYHCVSIISIITQLLVSLPEVGDLFASVKSAEPVAKQRIAMPATYIIATASSSFQFACFPKQLQ